MPFNDACQSDANLSRNQLIEKAYTSYYEYYVRKAEISVGSTAIAEDIVMDAFARMLTNIDNVSCFAIGQYWRKAVVNGIIDHKRRHHRFQMLSIEAGSLHGETHQPLEFIDETIDVAGALEKAEMQSRVRGAVRSLSDDHRDVVIRHHFHGQDLATIESCTGVLTNTIKSRLARGRRALERKLESSVVAR